MTVSPATSAPSASSTATTTPPKTSDPTSSHLDEATKGLGQESFLKLLVTQLQHQDPTQPMDDTTFITQLATFSSLEKLTSIDSSLKQLTTLVGGQPTTQDATGGTK